MGEKLSRDHVLASMDSMAGFPSVVTEILSTLEDPDSNLKVLAGYIRHDPVIAARVLSCANKASKNSRSGAAVKDIFTATSLIGMGRVRQMTLIGSIDAFVSSMVPREKSAVFWRHSVAVGVCSEEIALHVVAPISAESALISGLLHDIGQLWLFHFESAREAVAWQNAASHEMGIEVAEQEQFGVDHSVVGGWLAEQWELPPAIVAAIAHHHHPDNALTQPLVPVVHVAEVLANALDLSSATDNRVTGISSSACRQLGLVWDEKSRGLFGRMDARSRHANAMFAEQ